MIITWKYRRRINKHIARIVEMKKILDKSANEGVTIEQMNRFKKLQIFETGRYKPRLYKIKRGE